VRTFTRGTATPRDLAEACDELGIHDGDEFLLAHPAVLSDEDVPGTPRTKDSDTSEAAAIAQAPKVSGDRERVLRAIADRPATRDELVQRLNMPDKTVGPRVWELKRGGFVVDSPRKRATRAGKLAHVLVVSEKGEAALERRWRPEAA
jgi:hypothetical protein